MSAMPRGAEPYPEIHRSDAPLGPAPQPEISAVGIVNVLLRHRVMIVVLALIFAFFGGLKSVMSPKVYTVESGFMPKGGRGTTQLGGIAAQFGITINGGDAANSPQFYTDLLKARVILWPVAQQQYTIRTDSGTRTGDIAKLYNLKKDRPEVMRVKAIEAVDRSIKSLAQPKTGVITVTVRTFNPDLSYQLSQKLLDQVNIFNLTNRQHDASQQRTFVEKQVEEKRSELRQAEDALEGFLERNRMWAMSPELTMEKQRLENDLKMRQVLYTSMLQSYEQARIEEVRDLPVITVVEPPEMPIEADRRGGVKKTLTGLLIGIALGCLLAFPADRIQRKRDEQSDDFIEFDALKREALGDLTHPWRPVSRAFGSRKKA
jgi:uncharacterized protein involved in exopolysaccharide biosynthesis